MNRDFNWTFCLCAPANLCMLDCAPAKPHQTLVKQICIRWWNNRNATKFEMSLHVFVFVYEVFCQRVCSSFFLKVAFFRALLEFIYLLVVFMAKISFTSCKDPVFRMSVWVTQVHNHEANLLYIIAYNNSNHSLEYIAFQKRSSFGIVFNPGRTGVLLLPYMTDPIRIFNKRERGIRTYRVFNKF